MELEDAEVSSVSIKTNCVVYTAKNDSGRVCLLWGLDVFLNPNMFSSMKKSTTATHDKTDDDAGAHLCALHFVLENGLPLMHAAVMMRHRSMSEQVL